MTFDETVQASINLAHKLNQVDTALDLIHNKLEKMRSVNDGQINSNELSKLINNCLSLVEKIQF